MEKGKNPTITIEVDRELHNIVKAYSALNGKKVGKTMSELLEVGIRTSIDIDEYSKFLEDRNPSTPQ